MNVVSTRHRLFRTASSRQYIPLQQHLVDHRLDIRNRDFQVTHRGVDIIGDKQIQRANGFARLKLISTPSCVATIAAADNGAEASTNR
jgi:hypothetical protein